MSEYYAHWRDSGRTPKLFMIEAQAFFPIVLTLFHFRTWTVCLSLAAVTLLFILSRYQISLMIFLLNLREWILGREKQVEKIDYYE
ncbi:MULTISPECIES: IcmT/TraK family protein [Cysteiniphilum]|uniref:IcmT/TraK family protein n=1 Tax=Cysteiniphilum TaxID=2056696 RepID=UPI001783746B|nr:MULTISPECIES: IcmT/TraK family protein [Cysteiniphilum]